MSLLRIIKENKEMRSIFGKQELLMIEKQLLGVQLTPSEKTRLSRDIRKKFKAIKALSQFVEEFNLKQGSEIQEIIEDTKKLILDTEYFSKIKRIVVFGSTVDRTRTLLSDIDIAVEFNEIEKRAAVKFRLEIMRKSHSKIDIQVYNFLPEKIKKQIDENGKTIYSRTNSR